MTGSKGIDYFIYFLCLVLLFAYSKYKQNKQINLQEKKRFFNFCFLGDVKRFQEWKKKTKTEESIQPTSQATVEVDETTKKNAIDYFKNYCLERAYKFLSIVSASILVVTPLLQLFWFNDISIVGTLILLFGLIYFFLKWKSMQSNKELKASGVLEKKYRFDDLSKYVEKADERVQIILPQKEKNNINKEYYTYERNILLGILAVVWIVILLVFGATHEKPKRSSNSGVPYNSNNSYYSGYDYDDDGAINQKEWEDALGDYMDDLMGY